jgi:hypothetical protein
MENDKGQEIVDQDKEPKTPPGRVPVSALLSSPIEQPLVSDPVVVMPTLGDSPVNYEVDSTISYVSPTTPTFLSPGTPFIFENNIFRGEIATRSAFLFVYKDLN